MITQVRIALLAAVLLGLTRVHWIVGQVRALAQTPDFRLVYVAQLLGNVLFLLPLPVLLFLLYRFNVTLALSARLRVLAFATAFTVGIVFTLPPLYGLTATVIRDLSNVGWSESTAVAPRLWEWVASNRERNEFWGFVLQLSQLAVALFLFVLVRNARYQVQGIEDVPQVLMRVALAATIAAGIAVILNVGGQVRAAQEYASRQGQVMWWGGPTPLQFIINNAFGGILEVCRLMIPLLIYRSLLPHSRQPVDAM